MFNHHLRNEPIVNIDDLGFDESDEDEAGKGSPGSVSNAGGSKKTSVLELARQKASPDATSTVIAADCHQLPLITTD